MDTDIRTRGRGRLGRRALLLAALLVVGGCCLTNRLWSAAREHPEALRGAAITADHVLHLAVRYESGTTWRVTAPLEAGAEWPRVEGERVAVHEEPLPPSAVRVTNAMGLGDTVDLVSVYYLPSRGKDGTRDHYVWVTGGPFRTLVALPTPLRAREGLPAFALLMTPLALLVDAITAPVWVAWVVFTAGGHGRCWIPWCD